MSGYATRLILVTNLVTIISCHVMVLIQRDLHVTEREVRQKPPLIPVSEMVRRSKCVGDGGRSNVGIGQNDSLGIT